MARDHAGGLLGQLAAPMAITAEALRDLRERAAIIADNPAILAELAKGTWRAEENGGAEPGSVGSVLRELDGVGVISVNGPLFKCTGGIADQFRYFLGGTSYDSLWRALEACQEKKLKGALFRMGSPGGEVGGCGEFAGYVYSLRGKFPVWTYIETQCASAAEWFGAQAERSVAHETALVGWVGVIRGPLVDDSAMLEKLGVRVLEVTSKHAKAKRTIPLDDEVLARFQVMADDLGDCFEADVARGRRVSVEDVAAKFGAGDGLIAAKALDAGLIDEIGTFNSTLEAFRKATSTASAPPAAPPPAARAPALAAVQRKVKTMAKKPNSGIRAEADPKDDDNKGKAKRAEAEGKRAKAEAKRADAKKAQAEADDLDKDDKKKDEAKAKRAEADRCEAEADEMDADADMLEAEADKMEDEEPDGDEDKKALAALSGLRASASVSAHTAAIESKFVPRAKVTALESRVAAVEAERTAEKKAAEDKRLNAIADQAEELGYFAGLDEAQAKVKRDRFIKIARNEPDAAAEILANLPTAKVTTRITSQGNPANGKHSARPTINAFDEDLGGRRVNRGEVDVIEKGSSDLMTKARAHAAEHKVSVEEAMAAVVRTDSSLMK